MLLPLPKYQFSSCFIFVVTAVYFGVLAPLGVDFHHDGVMAVPAVDIASGKILFRDTFCQYGMLTPLIQAAAVKIAGPELLAIKMCTVLFYGGCAVLLDKLWAPLLSGVWRWINMLLFWGLYPASMVTFHPWSSVYALFFMLLSALWVRKFLERQQPRYLLFSGAAAALALLSRHPCGAVTIFAVVLAFLIIAYFSNQHSHPYYENAKHLCWFFLGCALPLLFAFAYLFFFGAWKDFYIQCFSFVSDFVWQRGGKGSWQAVSDAFFPILTSMGFFDLIYALFPLVNLFLFGWELCQRKDCSRNFVLIFLLIFGLGSWHQYYPVPCVRHLFWGAVPMFGAYALCGQRIIHLPKRFHIFLLLLGLPVIMAFYPRIIGASMRIGSIHNRPKIDLPGVRGIFLTNTEAKILSALHHTVKALPEEIYQRGVFNHTPDGIFSVILPRCDFKHPMFVNWKDVPYPDYQEQFNDCIQKYHPLILTVSPEYFPGYYPLLQFEYMGNNYRLLHPLGH